MAEKDGERGGRFPTVKHEHLLGLIGRSHSTAQAQAAEREERRKLEWESREVRYIEGAKSMPKMDATVAATRLRLSPLQTPTRLFACTDKR